MNYFLLAVILLICGGAYYEHTIQSQSITQDEQRLADDDAKILSLQSDNASLTSDKTNLTANLAAATAKINSQSGAPATAPVPTPSATPAAITAVAPVTPPVPNVPPKTTVAQMGQGVVLVKGDKAVGTGFLVKTANGPAVMTNLHVLADNANIKITTSNGKEIPVLSMKGASDRDLAMLTIADGPYTYLPLATDVTTAAKIGDEVITPDRNSQGGDVVLNTPGRLMAEGPDRVEISNPIYHGNSGGPVFHTVSGSVIGVVTEAIKVDVSNELDKTSFASRDSAISGTMRYFGLRIDNVPKWEDYDLRQFQNETVFLEQFNQQSRRLDSYLNGGESNNSGPGQNSDAKIYLDDEKIMAAHQAFRQQLAGTDTAGKIDALKNLSFALNTIADKNMVAIQNTNNFYSFNQQQAKYELAYRKALKDEIEKFSSDITRIGSLPRSN